MVVLRHVDRGFGLALNVGMRWIIGGFFGTDFWFTFVGRGLIFGCSCR